MSFGYRRDLRGDPYWLTLRYPATCAGKDCGLELVAGDRAFRFKDGTMFGERCGHGTQEAARFASEAADEEMLR
jgi:hypothetical protein